jgi:hypothetical protein
MNFYGLYALSVAGFFNMVACGGDFAGARSDGASSSGDGAGMEPAGVHFDADINDAGLRDAAAISDGATVDGGQGVPSLAELCGAVPVTLDDWEDCYQRRHCEWEVGCVPLNTYRDAQECIDRGDQVEGGRLTAERRKRKRAIEDGRALLDTAAFTQCLVDTSAVLCDTARFSVACANRFVGSVADSETCYADIECVSPGASCEASCSDACCQGVCRPRFKEGESCDLFDSCEPGLECYHTCVSGDIGDPCASDDYCGPNAWCDLATGVCTTVFTLGAACTSTLQCGGETSCLGLTIIDSSPGHCLRISHAGDTCDYYCYGNLYCDASGTCRDLPELGQSCSLFIPCRGVDTICRNGLCVLRGDIGAICSSNQPCLPGLFCTSELNDPSPKCAARGGEGAPCADPSHCESYLCSGSATQPGVCLPWSDTCPASVDMLNASP